MTTPQLKHRHQQIVKHVHREIAKVFGVPDLKAKADRTRGSRNLADARTASIFIQKTLLPSATNRMIADTLGLKQHAGYPHARRRIDERLLDPTFRRRLDEVWARLELP